MAAPIVQVRRSSVAGKIPTTAQLSPGEFAVNTYDGKVYIEQDQGGVGVGTTVIVVNPWSVGLGSTAYNTYFTEGNVGVGSTNPTSKLSVVGDANITGVVTANKFVGDGSLLINLPASSSAVAVQNNGVAVGSATTINFGTNLSVTFSSGTATVNAGLGTTTALLRNVTKYTATASQTTFSATYIVGYVDVFLNGIRLSDSEYTATNGTSIVLIEGASLGDIVEIVAFGGANNSSGISAVSISTNTTNSNQLIPYVTSFGSTTGFGATNSFVFNPSTGNLGIGITNPSTKLQVNGVIGFNNSNIRIGDGGSGFSNTSGVYNAFFGVSAGYANTSGSYNNFMGLYAGCGNQKGVHNNIFGSNAGKNNNGGGNNFFGRDAGFCNTSGDYNNFVGYQAGYNNASGCYNNFFGFRSGCSNTSGCHNTFFGLNAGYGNTSGRYNNFFGPNTGYNIKTGSHNNLLGLNAGFNLDDGQQNNFFGLFSGCNSTSAVHNNFFGTQSGLSNTSGGYNNFFGLSAGCKNTIGIHNQFFGNAAGNDNTIGNYNIAIGVGAGRTYIDADFNTIIGSSSGTGSTTGSYNVILGPQRDVPIKNGSNQLVIGSQSNDWIYGNSSYNVGIGITNPNEKLHIQGNLKFTGSLTEQVYAISGTTPVLEPDNGTIQTWTLSGISTPTDGFSAGQSMTLMIDDGTAYTINWPALNWVGGSAPTLSLTSYTVVELWKVSTTLYGALVGVTTI